MVELSSDGEPVVETCINQEGFFADANDKVSLNLNHYTELFS
jgi:hypothetical protein